MKQLRCPHTLELSGFHLLQDLGMVPGYAARQVGGRSAPILKGYIITFISLLLFRWSSMLCQLLIAPYIGLGGLCVG